MADREITGRRTADALYSAWHRVENLEQYIGHEAAWELGTIDLDNIYLVCGMYPNPVWVEYHRRASTPLILTETALDAGHDNKVTVVTERLAQLAGLTALCVLITPTPDQHEIAIFRAKRIYVPNGEPDPDYHTFTPAEFAQALVRLHTTAQKQQSPRT